MALSTPALSLGVGLATGALVYGVFQVALPPVVDVRSVDAGNRDVHSVVRHAGWSAAVAVAAITLITKDATPLVFGGLVDLWLMWTYHHANAVSPLTGRATGPLYAADLVGAQQAALPGESRVFDPVI